MNSSGVDQFVTSFLKYSQLKRDCSCNGKQKLLSFIGVERKEKVGNGDQSGHTAPEGEIQDISVWVGGVGLGWGGVSSSGS